METEYLDEEQVIALYNKVRTGKRTWPTGIWTSPAALQYAVTVFDYWIHNVMGWKGWPEARGKVTPVLLEEHRLADLGPQIRHDPNQIDPRQGLVESLERRARQDRQHRCAGLDQVRCDLVEDVRLYREDDKVGVVRDGEVALHRLAADILGQPPGPLVVGIREQHRLRGAGLAARGIGRSIHRLSIAFP